MQRRSLLSAAILLSLGLSACAETPPSAPPQPPVTASGAVSSIPAAVEPSASPTLSSSGGVSSTLGYPQVLVMALNGNHDAEFELGAMFHDGDGVTQDYAKALEWYTKAAEAGNRQAAFNLGLMYKNGEGTAVDLPAARGWLVRAADVGDVRATLQLGIMAYANNEFAIALPYFLKAAKAGLAEAQMNAGVMYIRAEGVPAQDVIEAYAWLKLAKEGGNARAAGMFESLAAKMTDEQKREGDARAAALRAEVKMEVKVNAVK